MRKQLKISERMRNTMSSFSGSESISSVSIQLPFPSLWLNCMKIVEADNIVWIVPGSDRNPYPTCPCVRTSLFPISLNSDDLLSIILLVTHGKDGHDHQSRKTENLLVSFFRIARFNVDPISYSWAIISNLFLFVGLFVCWFGGKSSVCHIIPPPPL